jgi:hypothetical protein
MTCAYLDRSLHQVPYRRQRLVENLENYGDMQLTKRNGDTAFACSLSLKHLQAVLDSPDIVSGISTTEARLGGSDGCPWMDLTGLKEHAT